MMGLLDAALANPWRTFERVFDGPLHPGGSEATERLLARADVGPGTRLLDVGCGAGDAVRIARELGADAIGLDPSPTADRAVRGDAAVLPVRDESIDVLLAECVLCLTDLPVALEEAHRVLNDGGRLALSDVVVDGERPEVPDRMAEALCLGGARSRDRMTTQLTEAGFDVRAVHDHRDDLLAMRDRVTERLDCEGMLGLMGERGRYALDAIEELETALEDEEISYISAVASAEGGTVVDFPRQ